MKTLGIDIGGSKMRAVIWSGEKVLAAREVKTPRSFSDFKNTLLKLTGNADKIGIAAPSIISGNKIIASPNIKYLKNLDVTVLFAGKKVRLDSDARCFARVEISSAGGGFSKKTNILFITLGTGIGRALVEKGKVQIIKKFEYPERWEKEYQKLRGGPKKEMDNKFADYLAGKILLIAKTYSPHTIIFGGGVAERGGFLNQMRRAFSRLPGGQERRIILLKSRYRQNAVAIGAAMMV